ncbi:hypothetical protein NC651_014684 [Populus alba x Populus x berolinensis]|nr:hypothetical protein NC651_014684 [Populus alba x Populus x berolinensis]
MPKNMKSPVTSAVVIASTLAFVGLIAINGAQARILPATLPNYGKDVITHHLHLRSLHQEPRKINGNYEKYSSLATTVSDKLIHSTVQVTPSYGRTTRITSSTSENPASPTSPALRIIRSQLHLMGGIFL